MARVTLSGGDKLKAALEKIAESVGKGATLNVGFLAGSVENTGVPSAYVALCNDRGGTIPERTVAAHTAVIHRRVDKEGNLLNDGRFVKKSKANFVTDVDVPEHVIPEHTVPSRPFFRRMVQLGETHWAADLGDRLKQTGYDVDKAMDMMGEQMTDELRDSIQAQVYAPLAASTIAKKGNDTTLIDSSDMINAVAFEITK